MRIVRLSPSKGVSDAQQQEGDYTMPKLYIPKANEYAALIAEYLAKAVKVAVSRDGVLIGFRYVPAPAV